ncbi:MAG: lipase family protein [Thioalkalivibrio sp.]|nr:lipase family protein [Thioalkalivibrio sp.]
MFKSLAGLGSAYDKTAKVGRGFTQSEFHAYPFSEPINGKAYARARWFDSKTGTFMSSDPMGYRDSSNVYAFVGGDPLNGRDPRGLADERPTGKELPASSWQQLVSTWSDVPSYCRSDPGDDRCLKGWKRILRDRFGDKQEMALLPPAGDSVIYVNGILTGRERAIDAGSRISRETGQSVTTLWNPTTDDRLLDILQVYLVNKLNVPDSTTVGLLRAIRGSLELNSTVTVIAHSQGGAILSSALTFLTPSERSRVDVIALGAAAHGYPKDLRSLRVVVNIRDLVPWLAGYGGRLMTDVLVKERPALPPGFEGTSFGDPRKSVTTHGIDSYLDYLFGNSPTGGGW